MQFGVGVCASRGGATKQRGRVRRRATKALHKHRKTAYTQPPRRKLTDCERLLPGAHGQRTRSATRARRLRGTNGWLLRLEPSGARLSRPATRRLVAARPRTVRSWPPRRAPQD
eukprot:3196980-Prymnesium_polylepis.3